jgi:antitoxin component YwqK of YwqJK toxin-antitoxin module
MSQSSNFAEEKIIDLNNRVVEEKWKKEGTTMNTHKLVDGLKHGEETWYYPSGIIMASFSWTRGLKDGSWKRFNSKGEMALEEIWRANKLESSTKGAPY